jgi:hypothetical protein
MWGNTRFQGSGYLKLIDAASIRMVQNIIDQADLIGL